MSEDMQVDLQLGSKRNLESAPGSQPHANTQVVEDTSGTWADTPLGATAVLPAGSMQPLQPQIIFPEDWQDPAAVVPVPDAP